MPSFDVVSEVDMHELTNAVDQTNREVTNRFDFKGTNSKVENAAGVLTVHSESEFQIQQMLEILRTKMAKRGIDVGSLEEGEVEEANMRAKQVVTVRQGIDKDICRKIIKRIKESKIKVQSQIQDEQVRVTGKKRDDLQQVMALLKEAEMGLPLQFTNFRD